MALRWILHNREMDLLKFWKRCDSKMNGNSKQVMESMDNGIIILFGFVMLLGKGWKTI